MSKKEGLSPAAPEARAFKTIITHKKELVKSKMTAADVELAGCLVKRAINVFVAQSGFRKKPFSVLSRLE